MGGNINNSDDEYEEGTAEQLPPTVNAYDEQLRMMRRKCRITRSDDALEPVFYQSFKTVALWMEFLRGMCFERVVAFLAAVDRLSTSPVTAPLTLDLAFLAEGLTGCS